MNPVIPVQLEGFANDRAGKIDDKTAAAAEVEIGVRRVEGAEKRIVSTVVDARVAARPPIMELGCVDCGSRVLNALAGENNVGSVSVEIEGGISLNPDAVAPSVQK